jgi:hypothetical protein
VHELRLPWHIVELVNAFPFGEAMHPEMVKPMILQFLPVHQEALRLSLLYYEHLAWLCVTAAYPNYGALIKEIGSIRFLGRTSIPTS